MKCHIMKRNFTVLRNQVDHMPLYNRSHGQKKTRDGEDIALSTHKKQVFLEKEIKSEDTLQSVALEFNVSVAELKRVNNIHKDNEIFARKVIKVPSNSLSLLLEKEYFSKNHNSTISPQPQQECDVIVETINNSNCVPKNYIVNGADEDQSKSLSVDSQIDEAQESVSLLSTTVEQKGNTVFSCSGADWGISWPTLLFVTLILGVGVPMFYVFWFLWGKKEKAEGS